MALRRALQLLLDSITCYNGTVTTTVMDHDFRLTGSESPKNCDLAAHLHRVCNTQCILSSYFKEFFFHPSIKLGVCSILFTMVGR